MSKRSEKPIFKVRFFSFGQSFLKSKKFTETPREKIPQKQKKTGRRSFSLVQLFLMRKCWKLMTSLNFSKMMSSFHILNRARKTMVPYVLGGTPNGSKLKSGLTQRWSCYTLATKVKNGTEQRQTVHKFVVKLSLSCILQNTWFHWNWNEQHSYLKAMLPFRPQTMHWMTASQPAFSKMSFKNTQMKRIPRLKLKSRKFVWKGTEKLTKLFHNFSIQNDSIHIPLSWSLAGNQLWEKIYLKELSDEKSNYFMLKSWNGISLLFANSSFFRPSNEHWMTRTQSLVSQMINLEEDASSDFWNSNYKSKLLQGWHEMMHSCNSAYSTMCRFLDEPLMAVIQTLLSREKLRSVRHTKFKR